MDLEAALARTGAPLLLAVRGYISDRNQYKPQVVVYTLMVNGGAPDLFPAPILRPQMPENQSGPRHARSKALYPIEREQVFALNREG